MDAPSALVVNDARTLDRVGSFTMEAPAGIFSHGAVRSPRWWAFRSRLGEDREPLPVPSFGQSSATG